MHGLLCCEVSFSKCFQFRYNCEPGYKHRHNHQLLPGVCNTLHGLLCSEVPFSKHFHYNLLYCSTVCGLVLSSAFLTIEIKTCFDTGDLGSPFGVLQYILWDIWHRHNHQLLAGPGVWNTLHGLLHCEVSFSKHFQFHYNREPGYNLLIPVLYAVQYCRLLFWQLK